MAEDDRVESLMAGLLDPTPQTSQKNDAMQKRYGRSKSAPRLVSYVPIENMIRTQNLSPRKVLPSMRKLTIILLIYLGVGTTCFYLVRHQITGLKTKGVLDSVYFCIVTMTTVGNGDLVPNSVASKLLACAFVISGMALVCVLFSKAADYFVDKQEALLVKAMQIRRANQRKHIILENETHIVRHMCFVAMIILVLLIIAGTVFLATVEKLDAIDAFYCICSTITTLGYGDKGFSTKAGRVFAIFWILTSTICLAMLFLYIAEINIESRQKALVHWVLTRKIHDEDMEAADMDNDNDWVVE